MTDTQTVEGRDGYTHGDGGRFIRVDDDHVLSMDDVLDVRYVGTTYVDIFTETHLWSFNHETQYVTIADGGHSLIQLPMTARSRNDLARAVPLV